jgi:hypothetical protein
MSSTADRLGFAAPLMDFDVIADAFVSSIYNDLNH